MITDTGYDGRGLAVQAGGTATMTIHDADGNTTALRQISIGRAERGRAYLYVANRGGRGIRSSLCRACSK
jgi:hypothetical protein